MARATRRAILPRRKKPEPSPPNEPPPKRQPIAGAGPSDATRRLFADKVKAAMLVASRELNEKEPPASAANHARSWDPERAADGVERAAHALFATDVKKYNDKARSLLFNLNDPKKPLPARARSRGAQAEALAHDARGPGPARHAGLAPRARGASRRGRVPRRRAGDAPGQDQQGRGARDRGRGRHRRGGGRAGKQAGGDARASGTALAAARSGAASAAAGGGSRRRARRGRRYAARARRGGPCDPRGAGADHVRGVRGRCGAQR